MACLRRPAVYLGRRACNGRTSMLASDYTLDSRDGVCVRCRVLSGASGVQVVFAIASRVWSEVRAVFLDAR